MGLNCGRNIRILAFAVVLVGDLYLSLMPRVEVDRSFSPEVQAWDIPAHCAIYFVLATTALLAFVRKTAPWSQRFAVFIFSATLGVLLEVLQGTSFVGRSCSLVDALSNALGALLAVLAHRYVFAYKQAKHNCH